jgi:quinol monooxygenase YgiN
LVLHHAFKRSNGVPIDLAVGRSKGEWCVELTTGFRRLFASKQNHSGRVLTEFHIVLVAGLRARPGREKALQELLVQMLEPTRDEPGCLTYNLHQSVIDPELFFVYAVWQDETCVEKHSHMKHAQAFKNVAPDLLEGPVLLNKWRIVG